MKELKITFTDEFLNNFDGTQEDLDFIVKELTARFENGEFDDLSECEETEVFDLDDESAFTQVNRTLH